MSHSLPHLTLTTSTCSLSPTSPIFPTISPAHTGPSVHDEYLPCDVPRQSGGSTHIPSVTGYQPKLIETEAIELEDLEPRKIELGWNLGTDPYQIQERFTRKSLTEDMDEFRKVCANMSYFQSQMHFDYDSAESIADSVKIENYKKCWLHHCVCKVEKTMNPLECQSHRGNLLCCSH